MLPTQQGAIRLFNFRGIDVFLHWSWFVVAVFELQYRKNTYTSPIFNVAEYLALFLIVLLHEFGHSLACRQVGGQANQIVLWPLGGVAYVAPPERPGAQLWSIAAGPLVNVVLAPILITAVMVADRAQLWATGPDTFHLLNAMMVINFVLLVFNMIPVYPLDGGQILRSVLWFFVGRARSLLIATVIGFFGVAAMVAFAIWAKSIWYGIMAAFVFSSCLRGWKQARALGALAAAPRREEFACPQCSQHPPEGKFWICGKCQVPFDMFEDGGRCPNCQAHYAEVRCGDCTAWAPVEAWEQGGLPVAQR